VEAAVRSLLLSGTLRTLLYLALRTSTVGSPIFLEMPLFMRRKKKAKRFGSFGNSAYLCNDEQKKEV